MKSRYLLLAVVSAAACADDPSIADKSDVSTDVTELDPQTQLVMEAQTALAPAAEQVEDAVASMPGFSSVAVEPENHKVVVYVTAGQEAAMRQQLAANATGESVEVRTATLSQTQTDQLATMLDDAQDELAAAGVAVTSHGADGLGGRYQVQVAGDLDAARAELTRRFGVDVASTIDVTPGAAAVPAASRNDDTRPYFGGSRLTMARWYCSSGFAAVNSHGQYLITAGHCYDRSDNRVWNGGHLIGHITATDIVPYDVSFVKVADVAAWVYNNPLGRPSTAASVSSVHHPRVGEHVCTSGSFGLARCGGVIHGWRHVRYGNSGPTYSLWYADQASHVSIVGAGDSGGPVYTVVSGTASARGTISGGVPNVACPRGDSSDWCSTQVLFGDVAQVAIRHGLRLTGSI